MIEHQTELDALAAALNVYVTNPNLINFDIDSARIIFARATNILRGKLS